MGTSRKPPDWEMPTDPAERARIFRGVLDGSKDPDGVTAGASVAAASIDALRFNEQLVVSAASGKKSGRARREHNADRDRFIRSFPLSVTDLDVWERLSQHPKVTAGDWRLINERQIGEIRRPRT